MRVVKLNKKIIVYLADLANTGFGLSPQTVPLAIGYIKTYAMRQLPEHVDIRLFRTFEDLFAAIQNKEPDIVGCSWYGWNRSITVNALSYIKSKFPRIITVIGGANVCEKIEGALRDFKEFPFIDIMIPNEGEIPFVNLLEKIIKGGKDSIFETGIDGVFFLSRLKDKIITGEAIPLVDDINIFPSPYLKGCLDQFLSAGLMPIIQASRGCPFRCAFCVSAKDSWKKLRTFEINRVKQEISYLESHAKDRGIRFTDENFGIFPRDLEIARFIAGLRARKNCNFLARQPIYCLLLFLLVFR